MIANPRPFTPGTLALEHMQARDERRPMCPLHAERVTHDDELYLVESLEVGGFDSMSGKGKYALQITRAATGRSVTFGPVWDTSRASKRTGEVKRRVRGPAGVSTTWQGAVLMHVAWAADRLADRGVAA